MATIRIDILKNDWHVFVNGEELSCTHAELELFPGRLPRILLETVVDGDFINSSVDLQGKADVHLHMQGVLHE